ncbi:MAG: putative serine protease do-like protein [Candidatus Roizmanbacteria bacterium GW2011_GWA2_36_23]|uniref:Putative serine protease do-like protein n=1 Tax=Candidatus Roizmanbacteria bacterium GW2011_GWA2_36_23 TaxID=1618480 RepID=A0A0G0GPP9_9BACT|nr:MAG: putative serine protease do-like protein [Candidatus Roizmanbacteria bacterium GW2011_GWA2_36_23]
MRKLLLLLALLIVFVASGQSARLFPQISLEKYLRLPKSITQTTIPEKQTVIYEESVITDVVEKTLPSVVTIGITKTASSSDFSETDPFYPFSPFRQTPDKKEKIERNIGSGFIISKDGLIITNKHVVSDSKATYKVLTNSNKKHDVVKIYRDPLNDLAILKIDTNGLKPIPLGESSNLKLGQLVIAIGTPLGEFTNTVTKGIISGLGRGITAGSPLEGFVEKLDNVIQTDAPINPGNSGGPLLNSKGQVIGINTAIAEEGQNIGFAIPVNIVKELIENFNKTGGSFERPYIGVRYRMIDRQTAILNEIVEGAYVVEVVPGSPADKAGIQDEDIIIEFDGKRIKGDDDQGLTKLMLQKKIGENVRVKIIREKETKTYSIILEAIQ